MVEVGEAKKVEIDVLADNRTYRGDLLKTWGLSMYIQIDDSCLLFDLDTRWEVVSQNAATLKVDLSKVEKIVISHMHGDHAGGLDNALRYYARIQKPIEIHLPDRNHLKPVVIMEGVVTTGVLGTFIKEQSLIINVKGKGPLILVGCSHPGLNTILNATCSILGIKQIYGVIGGYHIGERKAYQIVELFQKYRVRMAGPAHCTDDRAIEVFKTKMKDEFERIYTGKHLVIQ